MFGMNPALTMASRVMPVQPIQPQGMSGPMASFLRMMAQQGRTGINPEQPISNLKPMPPQGISGPSAGKMLPDPNGVPAPNLGVTGAQPANWQQFLNPNHMQDN